MQAQALRANLWDTLLHQISMRPDTVSTAVGPPFLILLLVGGEHPLGDLPCSEFLFGPIVQMANDGLCKIECHVSPSEPEKFLDFVLCRYRHLIFLILTNIGHDGFCSGDLVVHPLSV